MMIQLLIIQIGTFVALIVVLRMLFYRQLNSALRRLRELQEETVIKETQIKEELERAQQERLAEVEKGKKQAKELLEMAKKEAEALRLKAGEEARQENQKIIAYGKEGLEKLRQELLADIKTQALRLSIEIIKYAFTDKGKMNLQHDLMEELITEIEGLDKERFSLRSEKGRVISSFPLTPEERARLEKALADKTGAKILLEEEVDRELISGLVVELGEFIIDGSLKNKLHKVIPYLKNGN